MIFPATLLNNCQLVIFSDFFFGTSNTVSLKWATRSPFCLALHIMQITISLLLATARNCHKIARQHLPSFHSIFPGASCKLPQSDAPLCRPPHSPKVESGFGYPAPSVSDVNGERGGRRRRLIVEEQGRRQEKGIQLPRGQEA